MTFLTKNENPQNMKKLFYERSYFMKGFLFSFVFFISSLAGFSASFSSKMNINWNVEGYMSLPYTFQDQDLEGSGSTPDVLWGISPGLSFSILESTSRNSGEIGGDFLQSYSHSNTNSFNSSEYLGFKLTAEGLPEGQGEASISINRFALGYDWYGGIVNGFHTGFLFDYELRSSADNYASVLGSGTTINGWQALDFEFGEPILTTNSGDASLEFRLYLKKEGVDLAGSRALDITNLHIAGDFQANQSSPEIIPEPSSASLLLLGLFGAMRKRRNRSS